MEDASRGKAKLGAICSLEIKNYPACEKLPHTHQKKLLIS